MFIIFSLVVFRLTLLIHEDDGPFSVLILFRKIWGKIPGIGGLVDCPYCLSIWTGATAFWFQEPKIAILWCFGASSVTCILYGTREYLQDCKDYYIPKVTDELTE